jgi:CRISPR-associated protein Csb2
VLVVAETLRNAVLSVLERQLGSRDEVPDVVHGHTDGEVARWLPLPMVGAGHADGRIRGACIWLPPGTDEWVAAEVADAARSINRLVRAGKLDVGVRPFDGMPRPWASNPERWTQPSRRFATAFPAAYERRLKRPLSLEDVAEWCSHAGLPEPTGFRSATVPLIAGAVSPSPSEMFRRRDQHRPYCHLEIKFAEPVVGPAALGRGRQYGLGLLVPLPEVVR